MQNSNSITKQTMSGQNRVTTQSVVKSNLKNLSDKELYKKCRLYGGEARKWTRRFAALLPEVARRELYKKYGFYSIFEFSAKLAGMKHETVTDILRVAKKLEDKPILLNQLEEQGVNKLRLVANIATQENQKMLAEKVERMSKATLATFIQEKFRAGTEFERNNIITSNAQIGLTVDGKAMNEEAISGEIVAPQSKISQRITVSIPFEPRVELQLREFQKKLSRERKTPVDLSGVIKILLDNYKQRETPHDKVTNEAFARKQKLHAPQRKKYTSQMQSCLRKLTDEANPTSSPANTIANLRSAVRQKVSSRVRAKSPSRYIPMKTKKILYQKYAGRCAWPGCTKLPEIFHHTVRFALNPSHNPDHITPLCKNHERLAHHGLIENEEKSPETWRLRTESDRSAPKYKIDQKVINKRLAF